MSLSSINIPNDHSINKDKLKLWLDKCDISIKNIALEFILKTTHISYDIFIKTLNKSIDEMLSELKTFNSNNILQFYLGSDDINYKKNLVIGY